MSKYRIRVDLRVFKELFSFCLRIYNVKRVYDCRMLLMTSLTLWNLMIDIMLASIIISKLYYALKGHINGFFLIPYTEYRF